MRFGVLLGGILPVVLSGLQHFAVAVEIPTVYVGDPGNLPDPANIYRSIGTVDYAYRIATHEVSNSQYLEFLNSKDPTGENALRLHDPRMSTNVMGGIVFDEAGPIGAKYTAKEGRSQNPVIFVNM